jgi:recombination protein RecA
MLHNFYSTHKYLALCKVSRPYKQAEFEIIFGEGVSKLGCVLDCAELMEVVAKKGSWYSYKEMRLGQGREKALQYLRESPTICDEIEKVCLIVPVLFFVLPV